MELTEYREQLLWGLIQDKKGLLISAVRDRAELAHKWYLEGDEMAGKEWEDCQALLSVLTW